MSILNQETVESNSGFKKVIDESGLSLLLDTVQIYMYSFPAKSSTREVTSNAIDSITEKNIAKQILKKEAKVSDFYIEKEGDIYKDSKFNPDYYNLNYLSDDDVVSITYKEGDGLVIKDQIIIRDNGVGLGGSRLEGFFSLAFSSKRLNTKILGCYGLGAKAPLATGVDSFSMKTAYNGKLFSFNIYKDKIDSAINKWNSNGSQNDYITFSNGFNVYYETTTESNYVETSWEVKRHQKSLYIDAVKSQLLYFNNPINFNFIHYGGYIEKIDFQAKILLETPDFIIADQKYYSRPHLIVNGVCYGFVQFEELEMDAKYGAIGIKVSMDEITVTPSRESCVWDTKTKDTILLKYERLTETANAFINDYLSKLTILEWLKACVNINGNLYTSDANSKIISNLASLCGLQSIKLKYKETKFVFKNSLSEFIDSSALELTKVYSTKDWVQSKRSYVERLKYSNTQDLKSLIDCKQFIQCGSSDALKSYYLVKTNGSYVSLRPHSKGGDEFKTLFEKLVKGDITVDEAVENVESFEILKDEEDDVKKKKIKSYVNAIKFLEIIINEKPSIYEEVEVPDTFKMDGTVVNDDGEKISSPQVEIKEKVDYAKARKAMNKILIQYPRITYNSNIVLSKTEMKITDLDNCDDTIVYGNKEDLSLLNYLYVISRPNKQIDSDSKQFNDKLRICVIAKPLNKHFTEFNKVKDYLIGKESNIMCNEIKHLFTAQLVSKLLPASTSYISKLTEFSKTLATSYDKLLSYVSSYATPYGLPSVRNSLPNDIKEHIDKVLNVQTYLLNNDIEAATKYAKDKYNDEDLIKIEIFDKEVIESMETVIDFDKVFGVIFSEISSLNSYSKNITPQLAMEIKEIIESKREKLEKDYPDLCC